MNAIGVVPTTPVKRSPSADSVKEEGSLESAYAWATMYSARPTKKMTLYELERLVAKRMDLLAFVDQQLNSPHAKSLKDVLDSIRRRISRERRLLSNAAHAHLNTSALDAQEDEMEVSKAQNNMAVSDDAYTMTREEDLISHLLCRFAFCMDDRWRRWFQRTEETLLRARIHSIGNQNSIAQQMLSLNRINSRPLTAEEGNNPLVVAYMQWMASKSNNTVSANPYSYLAVPMSLVPRLVKDRKVIVVKGTAIISEEHALDLALTMYKRTINAGLFECYQKRIKQQEAVDPLVWGMLDAFLSRYVADQTDNLKESKEGTVGVADVQFEAQSHMPLCMRRIDTHLRTAHHLKHTGRLMYGLFLKQIGLSMEDAMILFSTLMSVKGGGSKEAYEKSAYGYAIRHNYGKEGKKTSYSSMGCSTIIGQPANVDSNDCHGCPFKMRDEGALRRLMQQEAINPLSREMPKVKPNGGDIEDIIKDAKEHHYTRACYKYFVATHPTARRDTLFRSPYEYYSTSHEVKKEYDAQQSKTSVKREGEGGDAGGGGVTPLGAKRLQQGTGYDASRESATRYRPE